MTGLGGARRGIVTSVFGNLFPPLAGFLSAPLLAHALGVDGRGEAAAAMAPLLLAMSMFTLGLPEALTFYVARNPTSGGAGFRRATLYTVLLGILGSTLIVAFADVISSGNSGLGSLIAVASVALVPCLLLVVARGLAAGYKLWSMVALERAIGSLARLTAVLVLVLTDQMNVTSATLALAVTTFIGIAVYAFIPLAIKKRKLGTGQQTSGPPALLTYGLRIWIGSLSGILLSRLDQLLMTPLSSTYELGLYVVAVSISEIILVFNGAVREVIFAVESENPDIERLGRASRISTILTTLTAIVVGVAGIWLLPWLFGPEFSPAIPVMEILLLAVVLGNPGSVAGSGLSARGRPGLRSWSLVVALVANIVMVLILVPSYGAVGAAWATLVGNCVAGYLNVVWLRVVFSVPFRVFLGFRKSDVVEIVILAKRMVRRIS